MWIAGEDYSSTLFHSLRHANAKEERRKKLGVPLREVVLFFFWAFFVLIPLRECWRGGEGVWKRLVLSEAVVGARSPLFRF